MLKEEREESYRTVGKAELIFPREDLPEVFGGTFLKLVLRR